MSTNTNGKGTRERLLEAACKVFAEKGYRAATIREICQLAESNIAAVNYHFGDKERLYQEVLRFARDRLRPIPLDDAALGDVLPAEQRLVNYVRSFVARTDKADETDMFTRLMANEMLDPTQALDDVTDDCFRPGFEWLVSVVQQLLGDQVDPLKARLCAISVMGQCVYCHHVLPLILRLNPQLAQDPERMEHLADHIGAFSLTAIRQLSRDATNNDDCGLPSQDV